MASMRYFNGDRQLAKVGYFDDARRDVLVGFFDKSELTYVDGHWTGYTTVERSIKFKSNPSLHECDARCMSAKGFNCECSCGGKNHGIGRFTCAKV